MIDCNGVVAGQLVMSHQQNLLLSGQVELAPSSYHPPPLYPRANLPPILPTRKVPGALDNLLNQAQHQVNRSEGESSSKPPALPPRDWRQSANSSLSTSVPTPPPRTTHLSSLANNKTCCDLTTRKTKAEHFCKGLSSNMLTVPTVHECKMVSSKCNCKEDLPNISMKFVVEAAKCSVPCLALGSKKMDCTPNMSRKECQPNVSPPVSIRDSFGIVTMKTCTSNVLGLTRTNNMVPAVDNNESTNSFFPNQVIPLSQWPIPVVVIPTGTTPNQNSESRIPFEWVGSKKKEAVANEYVEAPSLHSPSQRLSEHCSDISPSLDSLQTCPSVITTQPATLSCGKDRRSLQVKNGNSLGGQCDGWVTSARDLSSSLNNEKVIECSPSLQQFSALPCKSGLVCPRCKRCRCDGCARPHRLPRKWIGPPGRQCICSADEAVQICSCLCCIQCIFYHCFYHPDDDYDPVLEPCACCERPRCCLRWSLMTALLPVLPCLCCYCPLQCLVDAISSCYDACTSRGCRCRGGAKDSIITGNPSSSSGCERPTSSTSSSGATRDLFIESESWSA